MSKRCGEVMFDLIMSITFLHIWQRFILGRHKYRELCGKIVNSQEKECYESDSGMEQGGGLGSSSEELL